MPKLFISVVVIGAFACVQQVTGQTVDVHNSIGAAAGGIDPAQINELISTHNKVRRTVGVNEDLRWAEDLAAHAQEWASIRSAGCDLEHRQNSTLGENLFWASPVTSSTGTKAKQEVTATEVVESWAAEQSDYHYESNRCNEGKMCGHYTQIVWQGTREVGCGMHICPDRGQVWVCNYRPAGNYTGMRPY